MDAVNFLKEKGRMCEAIHQCHKCPISSDNNQYGLTCIIFAEKHPEEAVDIVEQWSKEHPVVTNGEKFREVFGIDYEKVIQNGLVEFMHAEYKESKGK